MKNGISSLTASWGIAAHIIFRRQPQRTEIREDRETQRPVSSLTRREAPKPICLLQPLSSDL
ncbi:MAG: hypothetical protein LBD06_10830 [Candidatus Accumulibacter sp.]|nr:hypothetical protein [Accumulibacter sp.]